MMDFSISYREPTFLFGSNVEELHRVSLSLGADDRGKLRKLEKSIAYMGIKDSFKTSYTFAFVSLDKV